MSQSSWGRSPDLLEQLEFKMKKVHFIFTSKLQNVKLGFSRETELRERERERERDYEELVSQLWRLRSPNLLCASWRPWKASSIVSVSAQSQRTRTHWCKSHWVQEKCRRRLMFQLKQQAEWILPSSFFLFYSGPQWIGWGPPTLGRAICLTQSTDSDANRKHPHRHTQK